MHDAVAGPVREGGGPVIGLELTDEQVARQLRVEGARRALLAAPDVIGFARSRILSNRSGEAGVEVRQERTPLHAGWTDTADSAYAQIVDWVTYWVIELDVVGPGFDSPWLRGEEVLGFRAGTSSGFAARLTRKQTAWLREKLPAIEALGSAATDEFLTDLQRIVWSLKATVGMSRRERPPAAPRPCPVCGEHEVRATFWGENMAAAELRGDRWMKGRDESFSDSFLVHIGRVQVKCSQCGHEVVATDREKARWIA